MTNNTPVTARWIKLFLMLFFFLNFLFCFYGFLLFFLLRFFQLGSSLVCTDFLRTGSPWTFPKDVFNVFGKDYFFVNQQLCQPVVSFLVFGQYFLGTFVLFINHLLHFFVNQFRSLFSIDRKSVV